MTSLRKEGHSLIWSLFLLAELEKGAVLLAGGGAQRSEDRGTFRWGQEADSWIAGNQAANHSELCFTDPGGDCFLRRAQRRAHQTVEAFGDLSKNR